MIELTPEREAVARDCAESEIRSGGGSDRTLSVEDIMDVFLDIKTRKEAKRVLELIDTAETTITWDDTPKEGTIVTDEGAVFTPWTDGRCVGYKVEAPGRPVTYVYLNPSGGQDTGRLGDTDVFIYRGGDGDPAMDDAECYVNIWEAP